MDNFYDPRRGRGVAWPPGSPSGASPYSPRVMQESNNSTWKPFQNQTVDCNGGGVIYGSVKQDSSGGFVHTFGSTQKKEAFQTNRQGSLHDGSSTPTTNPQRFQTVRQVSMQGPKPFTPNYTREDSVSGGGSYSPQVQTWNQAKTIAQFPISEYNDSESIQNRNPFFHRQDSQPSPQQRPGGLFQNQPQQYDGFSRQNSTNSQSSPYQSPPVKYSTTLTYEPSPYPGNYCQPQNFSPVSPTPTSPQFFSRQDSTPTYNNYCSPQRQESRTAPSFQTTRQDSVQDSSPYAVRQNSSFGYQQESGNAYYPTAAVSSPTSGYNQNPIPANDFSRQQSFNQNDSGMRSPLSPAQAQAPFAPASPTHCGAQQPAGPPSPVSRPQSLGAFLSATSPKPFRPQESSPSEPEPFPPPPPMPTHDHSPSQNAWQQPPTPMSDLPTPPLPSPPVEQQAPFGTSPTMIPPPPPPPPPPSMAAAPPPPPPPPPPGFSASSGDGVPAWKKQIQANKEARCNLRSQDSIQDESSGPNLPSALQNEMKRDKKPFTYLPAGLDLSEIRSPKMQRRILANQQYAPPPPPQTTQQLNLPINDQQQQMMQNQMQGLNLADSTNKSSPYVYTAPAAAPTTMPADMQDQSAADDKNYGQSRSFRVLQMMADGNQDDSANQDRQPQYQDNQAEMRFSGGLRKDAIPSRAFQTLQKMTGDAPQQFGAYPSNAPGPYDDTDEARGGGEEAAVDIRYRGGHIPGRSFKMLQEMTGDGGQPAPSVFQGPPRKITPQGPMCMPGRVIAPGETLPPKQFPNPEVPASQQTIEDNAKVYRGGRIPSQSFRILQAMTGEDSGQGVTDM